MPRPILRAGHYNFQYKRHIKKAPCAEDWYGHVRYNKAMHNFANTSLIIKNCISTDSIRVILQGKAMIITQKATCELQVRLEYF